MTRLLIAATLGASMLLSNAAFAAATTAAGTVKSIDKKGDSITLNDGSVYVLSEGVEAENFTPGEKVAITFEMKNGKMVATAVKKAK